MIITHGELGGRPILRDIDTADFSDLTVSTRTGPASWVYDAEENSIGLEIPLSPDPSVAEKAAIIQRITTENSNDEILRQRARALYQDLRTIRDSTGNLSAANLSNAVRVLARGEIAIMRLLLHELESLD